MVRSIGNSLGNPWTQYLRRKEKRGEKDLQKKVWSLEWESGEVMDDECGESMEPMGEVPPLGLGESELERLVQGWWREAESWIQRRGEAYWKELLFVDKIM